MRFRGTFLREPSLPGGIVSAGEPAIDILVEAGVRRALIRFNIDTGATVTILSPDEAAALLGVEYELLDFRSDPRRIAINTYGGVQVGVARDARLTFSSDNADVDIHIPIAIPPPPDDRIAPRPLPSLLGRDVLRHFRLELTYGETPSVLLETI